MTDATVRLGTEGDLAALSSLDERATAGSERWQGLTRKLSRSGGCCLVAEERNTSPGELVGYVTLASRHFFDRDFVELLVVGEEHRRVGVGSLLLRAAVDHTRTSTVFTSTNRSNTGMRALLRRGGWLVSGTLVGLDEGDPEIVFYRST